MQAQNNYVIIELENAVKEEIRPSGIVLLSTENDRYNFNDESSMLLDLMYQPKTNKGKVISFGSKCNFVNKEDTVIFKKKTDIHIIEVEGKKCAIVEHENILAKVTEKGFQPNNKYVLVKIKKQDRESLFSKKITTDSGEVITLLTGQDKGEGDTDSSAFYVSNGLIVGVGKDIKEVKIGDLGLIEYTCDNDDDIIVGYEGEDKIIAVLSVSEKHTEDNIIYENRKINENGKTSPTQIAWLKGEYKHYSSLYGTVRGESIISISPYCFVTHKETIIEKVSSSGIVYKEDEKMIERQLISISKEEGIRQKIKKGDTLIVDDFDVFSIEYNNNKINCMFDFDIIAKKATKK